MATTKTATTLVANQVLTAGDTDFTSNNGDLTTGYGADISVRITNGATGPTVAARVQIYTCPDGSTWFYFGAPLVGSTGNSEVASWGSIVIPASTRYVRVVAGSNTDEDVTLHVMLSQITGV